MGRQLRGRGQEMVDLGEKRVQNRGTQTPSGFAARSHEGRGADDQPASFLSVRVGLED